MQLCIKGRSLLSASRSTSTSQSVPHFSTTFKSDHVTMSRETILLVGAAFMCLLYACAVAETTTTVAPPPRTRIYLGECRANDACQGPPLRPGQLRLCCPSGRRVSLQLLSRVPRHLRCMCAPVSVSGTCWQGDQCKSCNQSFVGSINGLAVCCANCEPKGLILSPSSCDCNN